MKFDFIIWTDYDGKVKSAVVPRERNARRISVPGKNASRKEKSS